jgi:antitoxin SocA-like protein
MARADEPKLKELILYIADRMERDRHVGRGRIKLAKLLWRADFSAFWNLGAPITEARYHADRYGPSPVDELLVTRDLETAGRFEWRNDWDRQQIPVALDTADLKVFTAEQIALVDDQIDQYRHVTGTVMVNEAHEFPGWKLAWREGAGMRSPVPFESVFWDDREELQTWEEEHALSLAQDLRST